MRGFRDVMSRGQTAHRRALATALLALGLWLAGSAGAAHANPFGPPWQARVTAERTVLYSQPDRRSPPVGPLGRDAIVAVLGELKGADGGNWTATDLGFLPSGEVAEWDGAWTAQVSVASVPVYAKPNAESAVRRAAKEGDLLRVTGVSPGLDGDPAVWWATTEGYVGLGAIRWATDDWASWWKLPGPEEATGGWWAAPRSEANVRAAPTTEAPIVGRLVPGDRVKVLAEEQGEAVRGNATWYRIDGGRYAGARVHSSLIDRLPDPAPNTMPPPNATPGPWIVVDRSAATLTLVKDGQPRFTTYVALGKAGVETPTGDYATIGKLRAQDMTSASVPDAEHSYDLPNVPFIQYYRPGGFAIHGTYWHDHFGSLESQGCVNLTWADAAYLFRLTQPPVPEGTAARWAGKEQATPVVIVGG
jgi:lipoprotein-anchoring transpeptidase ErfK/SrfK